MEDLLDFDDAAAYPFGLSNNSACAATSVSCLENNHSVQSTVKASASRSFTPPASNSPPCSSPGCNALWDWITKSQMQLVCFQRPWLKQYARILHYAPVHWLQANWSFIRSTSLKTFTKSQNHGQFTLLHSWC